MTKEQVAIDNGGGGNWGAEWGGDIKQINTIDAPVVSLSTSLLPVLQYIPPPLLQKLLLS